MYKKSTVYRRIERRMGIHQIDRINTYVKFAQANPVEMDILFKELLIGVTNFFRDPPAWEVLKTKAVVPLLSGWPSGKVLRAWSPGCSTGEEAYSIAMMLHDELGLAAKKRDVQVFATDVNDQALEKAREGKYPGSIAADLPADFMHKYFTCSEDGLSVIITKEIREHVVFAKQDILTDPPFSRLDLIICRNLLIYLEPHAQEKCIALFHYALYSWEVRSLWAGIRGSSSHSLTKIAGYIRRSKQDLLRGCLLPSLLQRNEEHHCPLNRRLKNIGSRPAQSFRKLCSKNTHPQRSLLT
jgi:chemotaxis methyl-accepting protein methylase